MPRNHDLNALNRHWELLKYLPTQPPGKTSQDLLNHLQAMGYCITKRTVERDLQTLSRSFPLQCNDKGMPYGWYWKPGSSAELPGITLAEAISIKLVEDLLTPLLPQAMLNSLKTHFNQAHQKLKISHEDQTISQWQDKVRHVSPTLPLLPPQLDAIVLDQVQQALLHDRQIEVEYQAIHQTQSRIQTLHPLGLVQRGAITYLVATAFAYQEVRIYAVHRFKTATMTENPVIRPESFNLDEYIVSGALQFGNGDTLKLIAWISSALAHHLMETRLSEDQTLMEEEDNYLLTATVNDTWQLHWWILSHGEDIIVLEPEELRDAVWGRLQDAVAGYEDTA